MTGDAFTDAMYGAHVFLSPWDASPVPGGPSYREIAVAEMRAGETSRDSEATHE